MLELIRKKAEIIETEQGILVLIKESLNDDEMNFLMNLSEDKKLPIEIRVADLSEEEEKFLEESKQFIKEMNSIPESEKEPIPKKILDRWQSEVSSQTQLC